MSASADPGEVRVPTLFGLAVKIVLLNAFVEGLIMFVVLPRFRELSDLEENLLDIGALSVVGGGLLWRLVIRQYHLAAQRERRRAETEHAALVRAKSLLEAGQRVDDLLSHAEALEPVLAPVLATMAGMIGATSAALWIRRSGWALVAHWPEERPAVTAPAMVEHSGCDATEVIVRGRHAGVPLQLPEGTGWIELSAGHALVPDPADRHKLVIIAERVFRFAQRKAMEAELKEAVEQANVATRTKSAFLSNMSHELRTPMTAILGFTDLLMDPRQSESDRVDALQTIRRNGRHLLQLVNDILDLSKIEADKLEIERLLCDVRPVFAEVLSTMGVKAAEKDLKLDLVYATRMPGGLTTDAMRFKQILFNLVSNALKFTMFGGVRVTVRWLPADTVLEVDVTDTGPGMDPVTLGKLFQSFTQADASTTRKHGGTGLGLAISKRLACLLGGDLTVTSAPGRGSTFTMRVATGEISEAPVVARNASTAPPVLKQAQLNGRILLAEDGPDNRALVTVVLRRAGAAVDVADNGQEAVDVALAALARGAPYQAILMDMQMPVLDGYDAVALLRSKGYALPVIAFTAHAMSDDRRKCLAAGCDDHVTKPIVQDELIGTLAHWMGRSSPGLRPSLRAMSAVALVAPRPVPGTAAAPDRRASASLDLSGVEALVEDDPEMAALVRQFVASLPGRICELRTCADAGDTRAVQTLAHQLKGAAGSYGFLAVTDAAGEIEAVARDGSTEFMTHLARLEQLQAGIASCAWLAGAP